MVEEAFRKQILKIFDKLPKDLKEAILSEETADTIRNICEKFRIEENMTKVADYIGQVMLGILPPEEFQETLKKELKLDDDELKRIYHDINRYIFAGVKESLAKLYKEGVPLTKQPAMETPTGVPPRATLPKKLEGLPPREGKEGDVYREPIE